MEPEERGKVGERRKGEKEQDQKKEEPRDRAEERGKRARGEERVLGRGKQAQEQDGGERANTRTRERLVIGGEGRSKEQEKD